MKDAEGGSHNGWFPVVHEPERNALSVTVGETLLPVLSQILGRVRGMFDLSCGHETVACAHFRHGGGAAGARSREGHAFREALMPLSFPCE